MTETADHKNNLLALLSSLTESAPEQKKSDEELALGPVSVRNLDLQIDSTGIGLNANGKIGGKQILGLKFGDMGLHVNLNNATLAQLKLRDVGLQFDKPDFKLDVSVAPAISVEHVEMISKAAEQLSAGKFDDITAGIGDAFISGPNGEKYKWLDTLLGKIKVLIILIQINVPVKMFQEQLMTLSTPKSDGMSLLNLLGIENVKVDMKPDNLIEIQPNVTLPSVLSAKVKIAPFSIGIADDQGQSLIKIDVDGISMTGSGNQTLSPTIKLEMNSASIF